MGVCQRFGWTLPEFYAAPGELMRMLRLEDLGRPADEGGEWGDV